MVKMGFTDKIKILCRFIVKQENSKWTDSAFKYQKKIKFIERK